ncbi:MAG TPA: hypothetical protein VL360_06710 [Gammaproteobacteria bacterium]|nr:hypothetical protein [Gammaproteobacteria bacterium]
MFRKNYRNEVVIEGRCTKAQEEAILTAYEKMSALSDEHNLMFDANRGYANRLYQQYRAESDKLDELKNEAGVKLAYRR